MPSKTLTAAREALKRAKEDAWMHEISNDFYYTSGQKEEDDANIKYWQDKIKEIESQSKAQ